MSCSAVAASALLWLAAAPAGASPEAATPPPATALEPFFADIVGRAQSLKGRAEAMRKTQGPADAAFKTDLADLAELDMQAHQRLKARGTDGDLTCILRGIAEEELGEDYDIREFHDVILREGALPLSILEEQVRAYIAETGE